MLASLFSSPEVITLLGWILATCLVGLVAGCDCCAGCTICEDTFDRNGTDPETGGTCADGFTVLSGSFSMASNALTTSSANAEFDCNADVGVNKMVIHVDARGGSGSKIRVFVDYQSSRHIVQWQIGTDGCLSLIRDDGGEITIANEFVTTSADTYYTMAVLFDGSTGEFSATVNSVTVEACVDAIGGTFAGIGTGDTASSVRFQNFALSHYYDATDHPTCESTAVDCEACSPFFSDDFARANNSDPGCDWTEVSGTSAISSSSLVCTASNTYVRANRAHTSSALTIAVNFSAANTGDQVRLYVGDDGTNANKYYAQATIGGSGSLKIFDPSGTELATFSMTTATATRYNMSLCLSTDGNGNGWISAKCYDTAVQAAITFPSGSVVFAGVGTGTITASVTFEDAVVSKTYDSAHVDCEVCPPPCATDNVCCDSNGWPRFFEVTIPTGQVSDAGSCPLCNSIGGTYICEFDAIHSGNTFSYVYTVPGTCNGGHYFDLGVGVVCKDPLGNGCDPGIGINEYNPFGSGTYTMIWQGNDIGTFNCKTDTKSLAWNSNNFAYGLCNYNSTGVPNATFTGA